MAQINLLPPELRPRPIYHDKKFLLKAGAAAVGCIFVLLLAGWWWYVHGMEKQLEQYTAQRQELKAELQQVKNLQQQVAEGKQESEQLQAIKAGSLKWADVLAQVNSRTPMQVWLESFNADAAGTLILQGKGPSLAEVGVLVNQLGRLPYFQQVVLNWAEQSDDGSQLVSFKITVSLR